MDLFCFACRNIENIQLGIDNKLWAVASLLNQSAMGGRITKAERYLRPGAKGLLYCNPLHSFTTPFIVRSKADPYKVVSNVWPEAWRLPFEIEPLGNLSRQLPADEAKERWEFLKNRLRVNNGRGGVSAAMNITGTTVFVPTSINEADWEMICHDLAK